MMDGVTMSEREKRSRSVSIDADVDDEIRESDVNFSGLVNEWTTEFVEEGTHPAMDDYRNKELQQTLEQCKDRVVSEVEAAFDEAIAELEVDRSDSPAATEELDAEIDELHDQLTVTKSLASIGTVVEWSQSPRDPENDAIRRCAKRLGISPGSLVDELVWRDEQAGQLPPDKAASNGQEASQ